MRKGFTMIELVMVIVILGILAAVAIPAYVNLSNQAKDSACKGAIGSIRTAVALYYATTATTEAGASYPTASKLGDGSLFQDGQAPLNPWNNLRTVSETAGTIGWLYNHSTGTVESGASGHTGY